MDLENIKAMVELGLMALGAVVVVASVVVKIIPGEKDDEALKRVMVWIRKIFHYAPTVGLNPRTKELMKKLEELEKSK